MQLYLVINFFRKSQLIKFKYFKKIYAYFSIDCLFTLFIKVTYFENLHVTNIIVLNLFLVSSNASTKSRIKIKKTFDGNFIGYKNL